MIMAVAIRKRLAGMPENRDRLNALLADWRSDGGAYQVGPKLSAKFGIGEDVYILLPPNGRCAERDDWTV